MIPQLPDRNDEADYERFAGLDQPDEDARLEREEQQLEDHLHKRWLSDVCGVVISEHATHYFHPRGQLIIDNRDNPSPMRHITRSGRWHK